MSRIEQETYCPISVGLSKSRAVRGLGISPSGSGVGQRTHEGCYKGKISSALRGGETGKERLLKRDDP